MTETYDNLTSYEYIYDSVIFLNKKRVGENVSCCYYQ